MRWYDDLKLEIAKIAQSAMHRCREFKDEESVHGYQLLLACLAEDHFNLAIVGQFSRGKSTLMNAILGVDRLPTGLLPHTSVVTTVAYGDRECVQIRCEDWSVSEEVALDALANYVTESGNPGNRRHVISAEIRLPVEILRRGLYFIDTPGVGAIATNTETTRRFLPEIDSAIFVTGFDSPLGDAEIEFLAEIHQTIGKVFLVINKQDLLSPHERDEVLQYVRERLAGEIGDGGYELFAVSAREALRGKLENDADAIQRSGLPQLEGALLRFLGNEKANQLCTRTLDRLIHLLQRQRIEASLGISARERSGTTLSEIDETIESVHARRKELVTRIRASVGKTINGCLSSRIDAIFTELKAQVIGKFGARIAQRHHLFDASHVAKTMLEVSGFCARDMTKRIGALSAPIETEVGRTERLLLDELKRLPSEAWLQAVRLLRDADAGADPSSGDLESLRSTVSVARFPELKWRGRLPCRIFLVPLQWTGAAIDAWFGKTVAELLSCYRIEAESIVGLAADDFIVQMDREIEERINACATRLKRLVNTQFPQIESFDLLLERATDLRKELVTPDAERNKSTNDAVDEHRPANEALAVEDARRSCPICECVSRKIFDYLSKRQYELSASESAQQEHAGKGGFCSFHTWMYECVTSPSGICRAYPALLASQGRELKLLAMSFDSTAGIERRARILVPSPGRCHICDIVRRTELDVIAELLSRDLSAAHSRSNRAALCVPHLSLALKANPDLSVARALVLATGVSLERAAEAMTRFALKFDAVRRGLTSKEERNAHRTGLNRLVGDRRVTANWITEDRI
ncbi:MAG: dynamin family protein [Candidatus Binataceae bacterium]